MASYSDAELELLMADLESDFVERKESAADGRRIRRNICAFANDLPGNRRPGVVLVGVRDDGTCASLPIDDDLLVRLSNVHGEGDIGFPAIRLCVSASTGQASDPQKSTNRPDHDH